METQQEKVESRQKTTSTATVFLAAFTVLWLALSAYSFFDHTPAYLIDVMHGVIRP